MKLGNPTAMVNIQKIPQIQNAIKSKVALYL